MKIELFQVSFLSIKNQCYLLHKDNSGILIDPSWDYNLINNFLVTHKIDLKAILLTHAHSDHTNLAKKFSGKYNVPIFMSGAEIDNSSFRSSNLQRVNHLEKISVHEFEIIPILTPGHTKGSTCYMIGPNLFSGDTVFIEGVGICTDAGQMYNSVQFLKDYLPSDTLFWPGHSFGLDAGKNLAFLMENNIYFQFTNQAHFVKFRTRKNQPNSFRFK